MELPVAEFVDRFAITKVRHLVLSKTPHVESTQMAASWCEKHSQALQLLEDKVPQIAHLMADLIFLHETLWTLEDRVRARELTQAEFTSIAGEIFKQNNRRHAIKAKISAIFGGAPLTNRFYSGEMHIDGAAI